MHFGLTEEQEELAATLRALLAKRSDSRAVRAAVEQPRGFDEDLWKVLCTQVGVAALAIPEEYGGAGYSLFETHVALEQLGAALDIGPFKDKRVVIKGCGETKIPVNAFVMLTAKLKPHVKSLMYGEPCSTVPLFKAPAGK